MSVSKVAEISSSNYNYSDYHNPNIFKEKVKFNTKTSKIIEASKRGELSDLKLKLIDSMFPSSRVNLLVSSSNGRANEKLNTSAYSSRSKNSRSKSPLKSSREQRSIEKKIKSIMPNSNLLQRYKGNPYINR